MSLERFFSCCLLYLCFVDVKIKAKQKTSKQDKSKTKKNVLSDAPFRLSAADLTLADKRALNVCVPTGYGWKPCAFFRKKPYLKSHDWKQVMYSIAVQFKEIHCSCIKHSSCTK